MEIDAGLKVASPHVSFGNDELIDSKNDNIIQDGPYAGKQITVDAQVDNIDLFDDEGFAPPKDPLAMSRRDTKGNAVNGTLMMGNATVDIADIRQVGGSDETIGGNDQTVD